MAKKKPIPSEAEKKAFLACQPGLRAAATASSFSKNLFGQKLSASDFLPHIQQRVGWVADEKLRFEQIQEMLISQAYTLDAIFNETAVTSTNYRNLSTSALALSVALKAQNQCRATLATLITATRPPVLVANQTNIVNGQQQVNNNVINSDAQSASAVEQITPNKLLEQSDEQRLVTGTKSAAGAADQDMATVVEINRPKNRTGQRDG